MICFFAGELCVIFSGMGHLVWHLGARPSSAGKSMIWIWGFGGGVCGHAVRSWRLQLLGLCDAKAIVHKRLRLRGLPVLTLCGLGGYNFSDCAAPRLLFTRD